LDIKIRKRIPLSSVYKREENVSLDLAENLAALKVGSFAGAKPSPMDKTANSVFIFTTTVLFSNE
jgi:hypothetical protein